MKLKKVDNDAWMKCCRYCHYYNCGKCYNKNVNNTVESDYKVHSVSEEGHLDETLRETLGSVSLDLFENLELKLRDWKISEKRIKEFNKLFKDIYEEFTDTTLRPQLEADIHSCYVNHTGASSDNDGVEITNPHEFCCKEWC